MPEPRVFDLIIIGAGTAGMACAITAAQEGANIAVVEKADHIGGALHWSGGHMSAGGTRRQKAQGIEDSPEKHLQDILSINNESGDLALIQLAVQEAPHTIDWLDDLGFEFAPECPRIIYGHVPYTEKRTHYGKEKALSIFKVLLPLWEEGVKKEKITLFLEHEMIGIKKSANKFDSVIVKSQSEETLIKGTNIVLTTGGYGSNPNYFQEKHPGIPLVSSTYPTATGDGHRIAEEIGAQFSFNEYHLPSLGGVELSPGRCNFNEAWAMVLTSVYRQPREIYLNAEGKRFMAEDEINADTRERIAIQQKDWKFWIIFDEPALLERNEDGSENPIMIAWDTAKIKQAAQAEQFLWKADTIEELLQKCGLPPEESQKSIQQFNQVVKAGSDPAFGRTYLKNSIHTAPFYALLVHASVLVTFGGIQVNKELQIVDKEGKVLPGLYAAGEILGLGATSGSAFCSGMAITPALSFGRILGRKLSASKPN